MKKLTKLQMALMVNDYSKVESILTEYFNAKEDFGELLLSYEFKIAEKALILAIFNLLTAESDK